MVRPFKLLRNLMLVILLSAFIFYYMKELGKDWGYSSFRFFFWAWLALLGWLVLALKLLPFNFLGEKYYAPKKFEQNGRIYRKLQVHWVKKFMVNGDYYNKLVRYVKPGRRIIKNRDSIIAWEKETRSKELGHLLHLLLTIPPLVFALFTGWYFTGLYIILFNIGLNIYPIMVQRYNRIRISQALSRSPADTPAPTVT